MKSSLNPRKRLFIGLLGASIVGSVLLLFGLWFLLTSPERSIYDQALLALLAGMLLACVMVALLGIGGIVLTIYYSREIAVFHGPMRVAVNIFFPLTLYLGKLFRIDQEKIKRSFIEVNNHLVKSKEMKLLPGQILLLVPHCLQKSDCPYKITVRIDNCRRCGGCVVGKLLDMRDNYGIRLGMATGGTLARKFVREYHPHAIVAVACERDLTSGIQDSNPIPVFGLTNERPFGPCFNTEIKLNRVEEAIRYFVNKP